MPTADDPRVMVRLAASDKALLDGLAASVGVSTAALVREAALRAAVDVVREVREGRLVGLRGRNGSGAVSGVVGPAPVVSRVRRAVVPAEDVGVGRAELFRRLTGS